jgi:hypothetical protein
MIRGLFSALALHVVVPRQGCKGEKLVVVKCLKSCSFFVLSIEASGMEGRCRGVTSKAPRTIEQE